MRMSKRAKVALGIMAVVVIAAVAFLPGFIRARSTTATNACVNNLRQLDGAKQTWALEYTKTNNAPVTWDDVRPYLKSPLICPQGGTYILGRIGEPPRCSLGSEHALPRDAEP
jgi:hypothetical protein